MPPCDRCSKDISYTEWATPTRTPGGQTLTHLCSRCRRELIDIERQQAFLGRQPQPCIGCGRTISAEDYRRNGGYCEKCMFDHLAAEKETGVLQVDCPECGTPVDLKTSNVCSNCHYVIHPMRCKQCRGFMDSNSRACPHCGWQNPAYTDTRVRITKTMSKKVKAKIYETTLFELIGAFLILGLPFFGLPPLPFLALAFMAFLPLYNVLPSEQEALASRQRNVQSLGSEASGLLVLKSVSKTAMFAFAIFDLYRIPVTKLIPLALSWIYYFRLPVSYKETHPFEMIEAWIRVGVGFVIAFLLFIAFSGTLQATSLFFMGLAFFCTSFPRHRCADASDEGQVRVNLVEIFGKIGSGGERVGHILQGDEGYGLDPYLNIAFLFLMTFALLYANVGYSMMAAFFVLGIASIMLIARMSTNSVIWAYIGAALFIALVSGYLGSSLGMASMENMLQIMFFAVWNLSIIVGLSGGKETRPATGILMIFMALFVFTFTATGVMGTAVFGYWWPQVQSFGEAIIGPLAPLWANVQSGLGDAWLILTNPQMYYLKMTQSQQATSSVVTSGGTVKSIEVNSISLFPSITGTLEPTEPVIGNIELQNQGEFEAKGIDLTLQTAWVNAGAVTATSTPEVPMGEITKLACSASSNFPHESSSPGDPAYCNWTDTTYPNEMKSVTFVLPPNSAWNAGGIDLLDCNYFDGTTNHNGTLDPSTYACLGQNTNITYAHSGQSIKFYANLTYNYNVNVSIPFNVINSGIYIKKLQAGEMVLQDLTSEYTGGPVKATLWTPKQPARTGEPYLVVASIYNDGAGELIRINNFKVTVYRNDIIGAGNVTKIASTFRVISGDGCGNVVDSDADKTSYIICNNTYILKPLEYKRVSLYITPNDVSDQKTTLIVGKANYDYLKTTSQSLTVANAPPQ